MTKIGIILAIILILLFIVNKILVSYLKKFSGSKKPPENIRQKKSSGIDRSKIVDAEFEEIK